MGKGEGSGGGAALAGEGTDGFEAPAPFKANPMHIKYRAYTQGDDPSMDLKVRPAKTSITI
jgi:hypothetical protein